jgi:transposase
MPVQKMNRAIKYRAYPTDEQASLIIRTCGCVRFVWNQMLSDARRFQEETDVFFIPTPAKYKTSYPFLKEVDSLALANTQLNLKGARKAFCKGNARAPQFKSRRKSKISYSSSNFYVDSNGDKANAPHCFRKMEDKLARAQQKLARMEKGSHHYEDQLHKIQLIHEKIANQRKNFCHTLSAVIAKQWAAVFVEDINLRGMAGSLKLGKSTNDNGFGMFREMLAYKLAAQGKVFAKIDRWYPSSKACHKCGYINNNLTLQDREWTCPCCGTHHDRDHNAAINIRDKGLADLLSA